MSGRRFLVVTTTILTIGGLAAPNAHARVVGNGRIYYEVVNPRPARVSSILPDGSGRTTQFVDDPYWETTRLALSPDGLRLALGQYHEGRSSSSARLVTVDAADGANPTVVQPASDSFYASVAWTPSGTQLLFSRLVGGGGYRLFSCNDDGSGLARVGAFQVFDASMSPGGTQIAYTDRRERLGVMDADGANAQILLGDGRNFDPVWSPDGATIALARVRAGGRYADPYTIAPDGTSLTRLMRTPKRWEGSLAWAPDGTRIAFVAEWGGFALYSDVFTMAADGTDVTRLTNAPNFPKLFTQWAPA